MTELDDVLRGSFARIAEPGDPAGVAAAIQSRVDAGDTGTPADSSGFGGGSWLPWIGLVVVAGLVGGAVGVTGLVGRPSVEVASVGYSALLDERVDVLSCPGGEPVGTLVQGERVLAIARSDDSAFVGVRDPYNTASTVWLPAAAIVVDEGEQDVAALPVDDCDEVVVTVPTPTPTPEPTTDPQPQPQPGPRPVRDTTAPTLGQASANPGAIATLGWAPYCADVSTISVPAVDNVGVASVTATWSSGSAALTPSGSTWSFPFTSTTTGSFTITLVALDAAGNASAPAMTSVSVYSCVI